MNSILKNKSTDLLVHVFLRFSFLSCVLCVCGEGGGGGGVRVAPCMKIKFNAILTIAYRTSVHIYIINHIVYFRHCANMNVTYVVYAD